MSVRSHVLAASFALLALPSAASAQSAGSYDVDGDGRLAVGVFYDDSGPYADLGEIYSMMLTNLLGHFPEVDVWAVPMSEYPAGGLLSPEVSFYLGSTYDGPLPASFVDDFWANERPMVWLGYNLWQIGWPAWNDFLGRFGYQHWYVAGNEGSGENTTSYRYVQYNGKELPKFAWWNTDAQQFVNDPFVNILYAPDPTAFTTLATVVHSGTGDEQPWVVQSQNLTHVVEMPFTYIHERDRYLAFADMLHDLIGIDHPVTRKALFRLEDLHPAVAPSDIRIAREEMARGRLRPWNIAMVPYYQDPLGYYNEGTPESFTINSSIARSWRQQVNTARTYGAQIVMHGYTHQYGSMANPYNGVSGDDFEFWNAPADGPMAEDSYSWYGGRLLSANALLNVQRWSAWAWETPHYRESVADYLYTSDFFTNTYQRVVYYPYEIDSWGTTYTWNEMFQAPQSVQDWNSATVGVAGDRWGGQFFPYVIHHDSYGQRVVPENLGNIEPPEFALGPQYVRVIPDILAAADANLVNRCAFASVFYHPYLLEYPNIPNAGGRLGLRSLIQGIEALGYTFVQASTLVPPNGAQLPNSPAGTFTSPQGFGTATWPAP